VLRFRLAGIPVGVHWSFLFVAVLGLGLYQGVEIAAWTLAVFLAVLLHEMGHALTARAFRAVGLQITLFALGGVTTWRPAGRSTPGRSFLVAAAGSALGIAVGAGLVGLSRLGVFAGLSRLPFVFLQSFVWAALGWGILNWIPVLPLDGGHMLESLLAMAVPRRATQIARAVSVVVGGGLVIVAWMMGQRFLAFFLAFIVLAGWREGRPTQPATPAPPPPSEPTQEPEPPTFPI